MSWGNLTRVAVGRGIKYTRWNQGNCDSHWNTVALCPYLKTHRKPTLETARTGLSLHITGEWWSRPLHECSLGYELPRTTVWKAKEAPTARGFGPTCLPSSVSIDWTKRILWSRVGTNFYAHLIWDIVSVQYVSHLILLVWFKKLEVAYLCCVLKSLQSCCLSATPWTGARQAPLPVGFSRQEYWSGLPCPPPGDLPDPACLLRCRQILYHWDIAEAPILLSWVEFLPRQLEMIVRKGLSSVEQKLNRKIYIHAWWWKKKEPFKIYSPTDRQHQQVKTTGVSP